MKFKEKRRIKNEALKFQDKINRLGDLFKMYGFDVQFRGSLYTNSNYKQFYLRFADDSSEATIELIKALSKDLNELEEQYTGFNGKFIQEIVLNKLNKNHTDFYRWTYSYKGYSLSGKLRELNIDIRAMEKIIFKKEVE